MGFKILPSLQTYVLGFIAISLFLAATNVQGGWLYIIDSLLVSLIIFSLLSPINQANKLKITRIYNKSVYEGEIVDIEVAIENNRKKRSISFIEITDINPEKKSDKKTKIQNKDNSKFIIEISPDEKSSFNYKIQPEIRGIYEFKGFIINSYGPFGLFKYSKIIKVTDELIVFPVLPLLNQFFLSGLRGMGHKYSSQTKSSVDADLPYNVREYRRGDSRKLIHWKSSARQNRLMVKELENEQAFSVQILIDTKKGNNIGFGKESNFEYLIKLSGAVFKYCMDKNYKVEFYFYDEDEINKFTEISPWQQVLDTFAYIDTNSNKSIIDLSKEQEIDSNSIIIPFFLYTTQKEIEFLYDLQKNNFTVFPIFYDVNSFDKNIFPINDLISKSPFKSITVKKGDDLKKVLL